MKYSPPAINELFARLPAHLQILALQVIKDEHDRFKRGDFTEDEKKMFKSAADMGTGMAKTIEKNSIEIYNAPLKAVVNNI